MNTKVHLTFLVFLIIGLLCYNEGREVRKQGEDIDGKVNLKNFCRESTNFETHAQGGLNGTKINIPTLCVRCDCVEAKCYCCGFQQPMSCWRTQQVCEDHCKIN